ncbi:unnamed protein product [Brachionus calyciflorus]|uniref:Uncharacterized protein n=1 Tax=Brachionus calyciflorus TaxID=104777 RepID=A0A813ZM92_9BILA|nr:unnamed protein product [Brachionus calyciflorus]
MNKEIRRNSITKELKKWSKKTTITGIPKITESKGLITRILWTCIILVFLGIVCEKIYSLLFDYFRFNVTTRIKLVTEKNFTFPAITIKLINWLNFKNYKKHFRTISDYDEFISVSDNLDLKETFQISKNNFVSSYLLLDSSYSSNLEIDTLNSSIFSCYFNSIKCDLGDFEFINSSGDGAQLKIGLFKNTEGKFGKNSGLSLEIFTGSREFQSPVSQEAGLLVFIHDSDRVITNDDHGILVSPGTHTNIEIHKTRIKILPQPSNKCADQSLRFVLEDESLFNETIQLTGTYSKEYCFELCYQKELIQNCGCYDEKLVKYKNKNSNIPSCNDKYDISGFKKVAKSPKYYLSYEDYLISCPSLIKEAFYTGDYVSKCGGLCPKECNYEQYSTLVSKSNYPSRDYEKILKKKNKGNTKKSILSVNIYMDSNEFTLIEEVLLISLIDLISELGDNLGLFLGLSALSTFELIDLSIKLTTVFVTTKINDYWKKIKQISKLETKSNQRKVPHLVTNEKEYKTNEQKAKHFGTILSETFSEQKETWFDNEHKMMGDDLVQEKASELFVTQPNDDEFDDKIDFDELENALKTINKKAAPGPDKTQTNI